MQNGIKSETLDGDSAQSILRIMATIPLKNSLHPYLAFSTFDQRRAALIAIMWAVFLGRFICGFTIADDGPRYTQATTAAGTRVGQDAP